MPAQILITDYDVSQIFLGDNFYDDAPYTNTTGNPVTILPGTLMGRIESSGNILPQVSTAADGSEYPMAICADTYVIPTGGSTVITSCIKGRINQNRLIFGGTDNLTTPIGAQGTGGGILKDILVRNTGIFLVPSLELSAADNH